MSSALRCGLVTVCCLVRSSRVLLHTHTAHYVVVVYLLEKLAIHS